MAVRQSELQDNLKVEQIIRRLQPGTDLSQEQRDMLLAYSGRGQVWSEDKRPDASELFEFYTPDYLIDLMYRLAVHYGFEPGGKICEPSCANGRFFAHEFAGPSEKVGFELNQVTAQMAELLFPDASIHNLYFEQAFLDNTRERYTQLLKDKVTWVTQYPFDLVIGNPPYGIHKHYYSHHRFFGIVNFYQVELFFLYAGLMLLRKGGVLVFLTSSTFLRNGHKYNELKNELIRVGKMVDAYRMPKVFRRTGVPTDVMVWKRI